MYIYKHFLILSIFLMQSTIVFGDEFTFKLDSILHIVKQASYGRLRVIDARADKTNLGELKMGSRDRTTPLTTDKPLPEILATYYS